MMTTTKELEQIKGEGHPIIEQIKHIIHEGNVRRIIITQADGDTIAEFPLTMGVIGTVLAPVVAAIGAIVALLTECKIYVERSDPEPPEEVMPVVVANTPTD
jgi:hypothetical protein